MNIRDDFLFSTFGVCHRDVITYKRKDADVRCVVVGCSKFLYVTNEVSPPSPEELAAAAAKEGGEEGAAASSSTKFQVYALLAEDAEQLQERYATKVVGRGDGYLTYYMPSEFGIEMGLKGRDDHSAGSSQCTGRCSVVQQHR